MNIAGTVPVLWCLRLCCTIRRVWTRRATTHSTRVLIY